MVKEVASNLLVTMVRDLFHGSAARAKQQVWLVEHCSFFNLHWCMYIINIGGGFLVISSV